jgi:hypothetical protein
MAGITLLALLAEPALDEPTTSAVFDPFPAGMPTELLLGLVALGAEAPVRLFTGVKDALPAELPATVPTFPLELAAGAAEAEGVPRAAGAGSEHAVTRRERVHATA